MKFLVALILFATPALADETWVTADGPAIYEADLGPTGIISVPLGQGRAHLYFDGLSGNTVERYVLSGYWIGPATEGACTATLTGPDGLSSANWGLARIAFDRPSFPTGWTVTMGNCGFDGDWSIRADLE
jgi:hypothetical protein